MSAFFGEKMGKMISDVKLVARSMEFESRIEDGISDLNDIIEVAFDAVVRACDKHIEGMVPAQEDDHLGTPDLESHLETQEVEENEGQNEISVDDLIAESYTFDKSDEQVAKEFKRDLRDTVSSYAWLFVAIGVALDNESKQDIVKNLASKIAELKRNATP